MLTNTISYFIEQCTCTSTSDPLISVELLLPLLWGEGGGLQWNGLQMIRAKYDSHKLTG